MSFDQSAAETACAGQTIRMILAPTGVSYGEAEDSDSDGIDDAAEPTRVTVGGGARGTLDAVRELASAIFDVDGDGAVPAAGAAAAASKSSTLTSPPPPAAAPTAAAGATPPSCGTLESGRYVLPRSMTCRTLVSGGR